MKTKIEVEVEIPDDAEAVGELRAIREGDGFQPYPVSQPQRWQIATTADAKVYTHPRVILRKKWRWPDWIKPGTWIAADSIGQWWAYERKPANPGDHCFPSRGGVCILIETIANFVPPSCDDWTKSLTMKPLETETSPE